MSRVSDERNVKRRNAADVISARQSRVDCSESLNLTSVRLADSNALYELRPLNAPNDFRTVSLTASAKSVNGGGAKALLNRRGLE